VARLREARGLPATPCRCPEGPREFVRDECHRCGHRVRAVSLAELEAARTQEGLWLLGARVELEREKLNRAVLGETGLTFGELMRATYWHREAARGLIL
jgi:hypothetical protein